MAEGYHLHKRNVQGSQMVGDHMRANKSNFFNGHNVSIMRELHHSKECGRNNFHSINIVPLEEKIKIQRALDYHHINTNIFPS
jgi:hypothetical protein